MASAVQLAPRPRGAQWLLGSKALATVENDDSQPTNEGDHMFQESLEDMKNPFFFLKDWWLYLY